MVSMTYQRACETFRFAWQNSPPGFPVFGFARAPDEMVVEPASRRPRASRNAANGGLSVGEHLPASETKRSL
jgi:hypothetical protein